MNEDMQNEEQAVDQEVDTQAPVAEEQDTQETVDQDTGGEESQGQDQEQPLQDNQESTQSDDNDLSQWDSYLPKQSGQIDQSMVDENGYIDPAKYAEKIKSEVRNEIRFESQERRAWEKIEDKYPEIKSDKDLRELVLAKRINDVQTGGDGSLVKSAEMIMSKFSAAQQKGKSDAKVSVKRQKSGATTRATAPRDTSSSDKDLQNRIRSGDNEAIASVLSGWIDQGKI